MAKKTTPNKKTKVFNVNDMKKNLDIHGLSVKDKPISYIPFSKAYKDAIGLPGVAKGYVTLFRGFSDTGKSTAVYEGVVGCQQVGVLAIIIDTENSWSWEHAKEIGIEYDEVYDDEGNVIDYEGNFLYINNDSLTKMYGNIDHSDGSIRKEMRDEAVNEDISRFIIDLLEAQKKGTYPVEFCFFWDSIGSISSFKSWKSKSNNNMWNAGSLETAFKSIVNDKIPGSRKEGKDYTNTFVGVQKVWSDSSGMGQPVIRHKGGEAFFYAARQIIHMGGIQSHGTSALDAVSGGNKFQFGTKSKIKIIKNQVGGVTWDGVIASTPHGFINPADKNEYVAKHKKYLLGKMELMSGDIEVSERKASFEQESEIGKA